VRAIQGVFGPNHLEAPPNSELSFPEVAVTNYAGRTEHFQAYYDRSFGETGRTAAAVVLNRAERDLEVIRNIFGSADGDRSFRVVLGRLPENSRSFRLVGDEQEDDGALTVFCDLQTTPRPEPFQSCFFLALQISEVSATEAGWDAGVAPAVARVIASALYPRRILGFSSASFWLDGARDDGLREPVQPGAEGTGAAVLFLNYLHFQLGFSWAEIARTASPSLAALALRLTGSDEHPSAFRSLLADRCPPDRPSGLLSDNPFPIATIPSGRAETASHTGPGEDRRVLLLTGASGKLGRILCEALAGRYDIAGVHRNRPVVPGVFAIEADLTIDGECERVVETALDRFGRIDVLVNGAMASVWGPMLQSAPLSGTAPAQFLTNVVVPMRVSCACAQLSWSGQTDENRSANRNVINISSVAGHRLFPGMGQSVYAASKAALDHLTAHMALEFAEIGVRVNAVAPNSFPAVVRADRIVRAIESLVSGDDNGTIVVVDGEADYRLQLLS
jgi:NAD(P)-dependent dehydrogenase (short-subunit alcohol dehydrogenase family)